MITDVLRGERCPECRIQALHPEGQADRISVDEIITQDHQGTSYRVVRNWLQCAICGSVWVVSTWADIVDPLRLASWLRANPVQPLPRDCPR